MLSSTLPAIFLAVISLATSFPTHLSKTDNKFTISRHEFIKTDHKYDLGEHNNHVHIKFLQATVFGRSRSFITKHPCKQIRIRNRKSVFLYLSLLLICQSSDIECNPGPPKFPCGDCGKACTWNQRRPVIACDSCDIWFHKDCIGLTSQVFDTLAFSDASWICCNCGLPNFSSTLFQSIEIDCQDSYPPLSDKAMDMSSLSILSSNVGSPMTIASLKPNRIKQRKTTCVYYR